MGNQFHYLAPAIEMKKSVSQRHPKHNLSEKNGPAKPVIAMRHLPSSFEKNLAEKKSSVEQKQSSVEVIPPLYREPSFRLKSRRELLESSRSYEDKEIYCIYCTQTYYIPYYCQMETYPHQCSSKEAPRESHIRESLEKTQSRKRAIAVRPSIKS